MVRLIADLYARIRHLVPELAKFGVVGATGTVIDLGGAAVLHSAYHQGPLKAKAISIAAATVVTYAGSRYWTFRHRENQPLPREATLFVALNIVGLVIAELVIACMTYVLGFKDPIAYNLASLVGTGLGTIFRYFAYRKWVFLAPAVQHAPIVEPDFTALPPWTTGPTGEPAYPGPAYPGPAYAGPTGEPAYAGPTAEPMYPEPAYAATPSLALAPHSTNFAPVAAASPAWPGHESPWPQPVSPSAAQPPSWFYQPAPQAGQAPPRVHQAAAQKTMAPRPRSSGGRHRKSRSA